MDFGNTSIEGRKLITPSELVMEFEHKILSLGRSTKHCLAKFERNSTGDHGRQSWEGKCDMRRSENDKNDAFFKYGSKR